MEEKKKGWFRRHWILSTIFVLILLVIIFAVVGSDSSNNEGVTSTGGSSLPEEEGVSTYALNDRIVIGDFAYTVHGVETKSQVGDSIFGTERADGTFLIVDLTVENIGREPEYFQDNVYIADSQGREFEEDSDAKIYYGYDNLFSGLDKLQPNLPKRADLIFDVPQNIEGKIGIKKGLWSSDFEAFVSWS